ncbi:MAG: choice-of-anchor Q domain-containing protein [Nannocystales bacterium]
MARIPLSLASSACLVALSTSVASTPAHAASVSFSVDTTNDTVDINPGDGLCRDAEGYCSLRAAVMELNALGGGAVSVPAGTFRLARTGASEDAGLTGDLDIWTDIHISGAAGASGPTTVIQAVGDRAVDVSDPTNLIQVAVSDVEFIDGDAGAGDGGAIRAAGGALLVSDCHFFGNTATEGGAIDFEGVFMTTSADTFDSNVADHGGAIAARGEVTGGNSTFSNNEATAANGRGGALYIPSGMFRLLDMTFEFNTATYGGAFFSSPAPMMTLTSGRAHLERALFYGNDAASGGAAWIEGAQRVEIADTLFLSNTADSDGGAVWAEAQLDVDRSSFVDNRTTASGGAIAWDGSGTGARLDILNSTLGDNEAAYSGGGLFADGGDVDITTSTIADNEVTAGGGRGGGIYHAAAAGFRMTHTLVMRNRVSGAPYLSPLGNDISAFSTPVVSADHNIVGDALGSSFSSNPTDLVGSSTMSVVWPLTTLGYFGSPTLSYGMGWFSSARDGGASVCTTPGGAPVNVDQRGNPRPMGVACDIGAVEG